MPIRDLAGTGALQESLATTNDHLAAVLSELQETNQQRLESVTSELRAVSEKLDRLIQAVEQDRT
jgi:ABC-type transporter Mla subunit MlaD